VNIIKIDAYIMRLMYAIRSPTGSFLFLSFGTFVQVLGMSAYFYNVFYRRLAGLSLEADVHVMTALALGLGFSFIIESGVFFFAVAGEKKNSYFAACISAALSLLSYAMDFERLTNLEIIAVPFLSLVPPYYILATAHRLSEMYEASDFDAKAKEVFEQDSEGKRKPNRVLRYESQFVG